MAISVTFPVCGSTFDGLATTIQWTDDQPSVKYIVRVYTGTDTTGGLLYTSGVNFPSGIPAPANSHDITGLPNSCTEVFVEVQHWDGVSPGFIQGEGCSFISGPVGCDPNNPGVTVICAPGIDPPAPQALAIAGCPSTVVSGGAIDVSSNLKTPMPATVGNSTSDVAAVGDFGSPQLTWANDPRFTPPPCGEPAYQVPYTAGDFWGKRQSLNLNGINRYAKMCGWFFLPKFTTSGLNDGQFGSVDFHKFGIGFYPCPTSPPTGLAGLDAGGQFGWSVRTHAYYGGSSSTTAPATIPDVYQMQSYYYHTNQAGQYGDGSFFHEQPRDEWFYWEQFVCMNDIDQSNGYFKTWINGQLVDQVTGLNYTNNPDLLSINRLSMLFYHGGSIPAASDSFSYFADMKYSVGDAALKECDFTISPTVSDEAPECRDRLKASSLPDADYTATLTCTDGTTTTCEFRVGAGTLPCQEPIITPIVNGQSTITNPNDTPLTVTISSGSGTFQNPIPANSTVTVTNIVGGDGVNAAGEAIKTFCISGNC